MPFFCLVASLVMTAPLFISAPVPKMVTTAPQGIPAPGSGSSWSSNSMVHRSRPSHAWTETIFTQSITLPPPTTRMKSTFFSRASLAPSWTLA